MENTANITFISINVLRFNEFDHRFFGISDSEVEQMDPQQKLLLQCVYRALENAGIPLEEASGTRTGVFFGEFHLKKKKMNKKKVKKKYILSQTSLHIQLVEHKNRRYFKGHLFHGTFYRSDEQRL